VSVCPPEGDRPFCCLRRHSTAIASPDVEVRLGQGDGDQDDYLFASQLSRPLLGTLELQRN
jgi:hypothetical protein